jgi:mono/diheme cytochrome c family protein
MITMSLRLSTIAMATLLAAASASAESHYMGEREYRDHCAVCHGVTGKGDGILAQMITQIGQNVTDLTQLQRENDGVFPFVRVYESIDGRNMPRWHGRHDMPVWGGVYSAEAQRRHGGRYDAESYVRGRILSLIGYIHTLQE